jgi:hypothetical protein
MVGAGGREADGCLLVTGTGPSARPHPGLSAIQSLSSWERSLLRYRDGTDGQPGAEGMDARKGASARRQCLANHRAPRLGLPCFRQRLTDGQLRRIGTGRTWRQPSRRSAVSRWRRVRRASSAPADRRHHAFGDGSLQDAAAGEPRATPAGHRGAAPVVGDRRDRRPTRARAEPATHHAVTTATQSARAHPLMILLSARFTCPMRPSIHHPQPNRPLHY